MLAGSARTVIIHHLQTTWGGRLQGIMLYGSQATGHAGPQSDIDLAVLVDGDIAPALLWDTAQALACQLMVDVDLVDFRAATTILQKEIVVNGIWLLQADPSTCQLFETHVISQYQQLQADRQGIVSDVLKAIGIQNG